MASGEDGILQNETRIAKFMEKTSNIADDFKTLLSENDNLSRVVEEKSTEIETLSNHLLITEEKLRSLEGELKQCTEKELKLRQEHESMIANLNLGKGEISVDKMRGNSSEESKAAVADLSDKHRPSKIAELFNDVFENQWPEAMKVIENEIKDREQAVDFLRNMLCEIKTYCDKKAKDQIEELHAIFLRPDIFNHSVMDPVKEQLKCNRQQAADHSAKEIFKSYWTDLSKDTYALSQHVKSYVEDCFTLCWMMAVQDPPVVLGSVPERGNKFDKTLFREYTQSGPLVEFVVWPPLYLHSGGPILSKGVAQGYGSAKTHGTQKTAQTGNGASRINMRNRVDSGRPTTEGGRENVQRDRQAVDYSPADRRAQINGSPEDKLPYISGSMEKRQGSDYDRGAGEKLRYGSGRSGDGRGLSSKSPDGRPGSAKRAIRNEQKDISGTSRRQVKYIAQGTPSESDLGLSRSPDAGHYMSPPSTDDLYRYVRYVKRGGDDYAIDRLGENLFNACVIRYKKLMQKGVDLY